MRRRRSAKAIGHAAIRAIAERVVRVMDFNGDGVRWHGHRRILSAGH